MTVGRLLNYSPKLTIFEHAPASSDTYHPAIVLFIGGLGDGLGTVPYVPALAKALDAHGWGLAELLFSSSYEGWGFGSLPRDAREMARAVAFLRANSETRKQRVVLMGHSTGTQNLIYYATQGADPALRPPVDGLVLQASVSDREAFVKANGDEKWQEALAHAQALLQADVAAQNKTPVKTEALGFSPMPPQYTRLFFGVQISSYRWISLMQVRGEDDFFSSDLDDKDLESTFGKVAVPLLVLYSGADEYVPVKVDKKKLLQRFQNATKSSLWSPVSHVVPNATHNLADSPQSAYDDLISSVVTFIQSL